jgi:hypothetical protein
MVRAGEAATGPCRFAHAYRYLTGRDPGREQEACEGSMSTTRLTGRVSPVQREDFQLCGRHSRLIRDLR